MIAQIAADIIREFALEIGVEIQEILDFPPPSEDFLYRFAVGHDCSGELAAVLFAETKRLLLVCAIEDSALGFTPSLGIAMMLKHFTGWFEAFRQFCSLLGLSDFLICWSVSTVPQLSFAETRQKIEAIFGPSDERCWAFSTPSGICVSKLRPPEETA